MRKTVCAALFTASLALPTGAALSWQPPIGPAPHAFEWSLPFLDLDLNDVTQVRLSWSYPYVRLVRRPVFEFSIGNFF
jgi:hypothetical protein